LADGRPALVNRVTFDLAGAPRDREIQLQPGLWEMTARFQHVDLQNVAPQSRAHIFDPVVVRQCLTPDWIAQWRRARAAYDRARGCTVSTLTMAGGHISSTQVCPLMRAVTTGTYTATSYEMLERKLVLRNSHPYTIEQRRVAHRIGACNGRSAPAI
jgi:hypothetical protein